MHMSGNGFHTVLSLLHDEAFIEIRRAAGRKALPYKVFKTMPMPAGYTVDETWTFLTTMRRQTAVVMPWRSYHLRNEELWYSITQNIDTLLTEVETRC